MADKSYQSAFDAPLPPELKRLEPLLGTWTEGHTRDSVFGPGVPVTSSESFRWLGGSYFLVQEYETTFGDDAPQRGVVHWATTPCPEASGSSFSATTDPLPRRATATRARCPTRGSRPLVWRASSMSWTTKGRSRRMRTVRGLCVAPRREGRVAGLDGSQVHEDPRLTAWLCRACDR